MPARVRKPKDKALVEDAVKLTYARIYPELKEEDPTPYLIRAKEIDPVVEDFLQIVIERKKTLLAACKSCKGILYHLRIKLEKTDSLLPANMLINLVCITICQWPIFLPKDLTE